MTDRRRFRNGRVYRRDWRDGLRNYRRHQLLRRHLRDCDGLLDLNRRRHCQVQFPFDDIHFPLNGIHFFAGVVKSRKQVANLARLTFAALEQLFHFGDASFKLGAVAFRFVKNFFKVRDVIFHAPDNFGCRPFKFLFELAG